MIKFTEEKSQKLLDETHKKEAEDLAQFFPKNTTFRILIYRE